MAPRQKAEAWLNMYLVETTCTHHSRFLSESPGRTSAQAYSNVRDRSGHPSRNLKFFHFGHQCPHNARLMTMIERFSDEQHVPFQAIDVSEHEDACRKFRIFSPNMLLVNDKHRLHGPITRTRLKAVAEDEEIEPIGYEVRQSHNVIRGSLVPLTPNSVLSTCRPCMGSDDESLCRPKSEWVRTALKSLGLKHLGYLHFCDGVCVGGAEFVPSENVPYPIPDKRRGNAFITCCYLSDEHRDYKTHPLARLIRDL